MRLTAAASCQQRWHAAVAIVLTSALLRLEPVAASGGGLIRPAEAVEADAPHSVREATLVVATSVPESQSEDMTTTPMPDSPTTTIADILRENPERAASFEEVAAGSGSDAVPPSHHETPLDVVTNGIDKSNAPKDDVQDAADEDCGCRAARGECEGNEEFMKQYCPASCQRESECSTFIKTGGFSAIREAAAHVRTEAKRFMDERDGLKGDLDECRQNTQAIQLENNKTVQKLKQELRMCTGPSPTAKCDALVAEARRAEEKLSAEKLRAQMASQKRLLDAECQTRMASTEANLQHHRTAAERARQATTSAMEEAKQIKDMLTSLETDLHSKTQELHQAREMHATTHAKLTEVESQVDVKADKKVKELEEKVKSLEKGCSGSKSVSSAGEDTSMETMRLDFAHMQELNANYEQQLQEAASKLAKAEARAKDAEEQLKDANQAADEDAEAASGLNSVFEYEIRRLRALVDEKDASIKELQESTALGPVGGGQLCTYPPGLEGQPVAALHGQMNQMQRTIESQEKKLTSAVARYMDAEASNREAQKRAQESERRLRIYAKTASGEEGARQMIVKQEEELIQLQRKTAELEERIKSAALEPENWAMKLEKDIINKEEQVERLSTDLSKAREDARELGIKVDLLESTGNLQAGAVPVPFYALYVVAALAAAGVAMAFRPITEGKPKYENGHAINAALSMNGASSPTLLEAQKGSFSPPQSRPMSPQNGMAPTQLLPPLTHMPPMAAPQMHPMYQMGPSPAQMMQQQMQQQMQMQQMQMQQQQQPHPQQAPQAMHPGQDMGHWEPNTPGLMAQSPRMLDPRLAAPSMIAQAPHPMEYPRWEAQTPVMQSSPRALDPTQQWYIQPGMVGGHAYEVSPMTMTQAHAHWDRSGLAQPAYGSGMPLEKQTPRTRMGQDASPQRPVPTALDQFAGYDGTGSQPLERGAWHPEMQSVPEEESMGDAAASHQVLDIGTPLPMNLPAAAAAPSKREQHLEEMLALAVAKLEVAARQQDMWSPREGETHHQDFAVLESKDSYNASPTPRRASRPWSPKQLGGGHIGAPIGSGSPTQFRPLEAQQTTYFNMATDDSPGAVLNGDRSPMIPSGGNSPNKGSAGGRNKQRILATNRSKPVPTLRSPPMVRGGKLSLVPVGAGTNTVTGAAAAAAAAAGGNGMSVAPGHVEAVVAEFEGTRRHLQESGRLLPGQDPPSAKDSSGMKSLMSKLSTIEDKLSEFNGKIDRMAAMSEPTSPAC